MYSYLKNVVLKKAALSILHQHASVRLEKLMLFIVLDGTGLRVCGLRVE